MISLAALLPARAEAKVYAYTANEGSNTVSIIDTDLNRQVRVIKVGLRPLRLEASRDGKRLYVTNSQGNSVSVIDLTIGALVTNIPVQLRPMELAVTPDGREVYVCNAYSESLSVIDAESLSVVATIDLGIAPNGGVVITPDGRWAYAVLPGYVAAIDTTTHAITKWIATGRAANRPIISRDGTRIYFGNGANGTVSIVDTTTQTFLGTTSYFGSGVRRVAESPDGRWVYGVAYYDGIVGVMDRATDTLVDTVAVGNVAWSVEFTLDSAHAYVCNAGDGDVDVIDTGTRVIVATPAVGNGCYWFALTPAGDRMYVTVPPEGTVACIDTATQTTIATIPVGASPWKIVVADVPNPLPSAPQLTSVDPATLDQGTVTTVTVTGANFMDGCVASVSPAYRGTRVDSVQVDDEENLTLTISTTSTARRGLYSLTVRNLDGQTGTLTDALNVQGSPSARVTESGWD